MLLESEVLIVQLGYNALFFLQLVVELVNLILLENAQNTREIYEVSEVYQIDELYVIVFCQRVSCVYLLVDGHVAR